MTKPSSYVDELDSVDDQSSTAPGLAPSIVCLIEVPLGGMGADERASISIVTVTPSTGDVVWDDFEDNFIRTELEVCSQSVPDCARVQIFSFYR